MLAPGWGGKQMLYTQRAFFLEIVGPNWDNIYRIGDVQKEHDFDWIWVCFNVVPCVSGTGSHDNLQNFSSRQWLFYGGSLWWFTPWQGLEGVLGWCLQQDIEHTLTISVFALIEGSPPTLLDGKLATNGTAQHRLAFNRPASCDLTYGSP